MTLHDLVQFFLHLPAMHGGGSNDMNSRAEMLSRVLVEGLIDDETIVGELLADFEEMQHEERSDDDDDEPINPARLRMAVNPWPTPQSSLSGCSPRVLIGMQFFHPTRMNSCT